MSLLPRPPADASLVVHLARIVGAGAVSTLDADRFAYARDCWPRDVMRVRAGEVPAAPACVVWPESPEEIARILALASELGIPVVPFGAGSGVAGGAKPSRGGIVIDTKRMRAIRALDEVNLRAEVETGIIGERLERALNERGFTLGHFPSSIICSTLGGWLAARSAGQASTLYGKIEDMTLGLEVVTPGRVRRLAEGPRPPRGPDWNALVIGSEGTLGVITAAELRIRPLPEERLLRGLRFPSVEAGAEAIRRMLRAGLLPAVVRLYDALDTLVAGTHGDESEEAEEARALEAVSSRAKGLFEEITRRIPGASRGGGRKTKNRVGGEIAKTLVRGTVRAVLGAPIALNRAASVLPEDCLMILGFEGQPALIGAEMAAARAIAEAQGAVDLGPGPGEHWLKTRYNISYKASKAYAMGAFADTMEVAATWDRLMPLYRNVRRAISKDAFVLAHFSHAYPEGCSIYFTFAGASPDPDEPSAALERYDRIWKSGLAAVHESGGTISHHHGVGELKGQAMAREHGPGGMRLLGALKSAFDPRGVMNPDKLGLEAPPRFSGTRSLPPEPAPEAASASRAGSQRNGGSAGVRPAGSPPVPGGSGPSRPAGSGASRPASAAIASAAAVDPSPAVVIDPAALDLLANELAFTDTTTGGLSAFSPIDNAALARAEETALSRFPREIRSVVGEKNITTASDHRVVVRPPDESALAAVLRVACSRGIAVVTEQTGFRAPTGAVQVDLSRFEGISRMSANSLFVEVESGIEVARLEAMLARHGLTLGPVHPRAMPRSVGAALSKNLLVRRSIAFGDLRSVCFAVRALLANGAPIETRPVPRSATGPELDRALIGGEGRWGIITRATLRVAVAPTVREELAYQFPSLDAAVEHARLVLRRGVRPAAARILSSGLVAFELMSQSDAIARAEQAIIGSAASHLEGRAAESSGVAQGGRFDAVVEVAALWTKAARTLESMQKAAGGEAWIDFLAPEGVTVVARVVDRQSRLAALAASAEAGAQVIAGQRGPAIDPVRAPLSYAASGPRAGAGARGPDGYLDMLQKVSSSLDPAGVFRGRAPGGGG